MSVLRGRLEYSGWNVRPWRFFADSGEYDLWKKIEPSFWALSGHHCFLETSQTSFSIALDGNSEWVFHYKAGGDVCLRKFNNDGGYCFLNVAFLFNRFLQGLCGQDVVAEFGGEYFKISAAQSAQNERER